MRSVSWAAKWVYFFFFAAGAALLPYLTLFYREAGLSGRMVGILAGLAPAATVLGSWVWGAIADKTGRHKIVLWLAFGGAIGAAQLFTAGSSFGLLLGVASLFAFFWAPIIPILDNSVLDIVRRTGENYGRIRLWGSTGWGIVAPVVGILIGAVGLRVIFPVYGVMMAITALVAIRLPVRSGKRLHNFWEHFRRMVRDPRWVFFILAVFATGFGGAFINNYLMIYLAELGASPTLRGVALSIATVSEAFAFAFADRALKRFGPERLILVAMGATSIRLFLHYVIRTPELILAVQLMHGLTFSIFVVAGVTLARELAPEGLVATSQGIFTGVTFGVSAIAGGYLGGELLDAVGVHSMYLVAGIATSAGLLVFVLYRVLRRKRAPGEA